MTPAGNCTLPVAGQQCGAKAIARYQVRDDDGLHEIFRCAQHDPAALNVFAVRAGGLETRQALR